MHEFSIVMALLEQVDEQARRHDAQAVRSVRVRIGELSGAEPELVKTAFEILRVGTLCATADVDIVPVPASWACEGCDRPIAGGPLCCPECGRAARLVAGDDLILETIQLEVA
jgi:hydrogenase nickel incorporation protein HypA/HybF